MPTMLIYIIRCKGYLCLTPYIWEVGEKGPYDRCMNATIFAKSSMNLMFDISSLMSTIRKCEKECNRTPFSVVCPLTTT